MLGLLKSFDLAETDRCGIRRYGRGLYKVEI